jgi:ferredoxin
MIPAQGYLKEQIKLLIKLGFCYSFMIITQLKSLSEILDKIKGDPVFIIGCSECATLCHTGGEQEVQEIKTKLEGNSVHTTGWVILDPACHLQKNKNTLRSYEEQIKSAKKILVLSCGAGAQTLTEIMPNKEIITGTDSLFLGEIKHVDEFLKRCSLCGECMLDNYSGLCPISQCPKQMLNGPCSGSNKGKCEVDEETDCVWYLIYQRLKEKKEMGKYKCIRKPKDWSKSDIKTRRI